MPLNNCTIWYEPKIFRYVQNTRYHLHLQTILYIKSDKKSYIFYIAIRAFYEIIPLVCSYTQGLVILTQTSRENQTERPTTYIS